MRQWGTQTKLQQHFDATPSKWTAKFMKLLHAFTKRNPIVDAGVCLQTEARRLAGTAQVAQRCDELHPGCGAMPIAPDGRERGSNGSQPLSAVARLMDRETAAVMDM